MSKQLGSVGGTVEITNGATARSSGQVFLFGTLPVVALDDIAANAVGTVHVSGVFAFAAQSGAVTAGQVAYLSGAGAVVNVATNNTKIGYFLEGSLSGNTDPIKVLLHP